MKLIPRIQDNLNRAIYRPVQNLYDVVGMECLRNLTILHKILYKYNEIVGFMSSPHIEAHKCQNGLIAMKNRLHCLTNDFYVIFSIRH